MEMILGWGCFLVSLGILWALSAAVITGVRIRSNQAQIEARLGRVEIELARVQQALARLERAGEAPLEAAPARRETPEPAPAAVEAPGERRAAALTDFEIPRAAPPAGGPPPLSPPPVPIARAVEEARPEPPLRAARAAGPAPVERAAPAARPAERAGPSWEERIGGQWATWLGAVTAVFCVGLLIKWAYDSGWITPHVILALGWIAGAALLGGGEWFRSRLPLYAQGLAGGGIAALYVTTYAGHALYDVLAAEAATLLLVLVGALAIATALRHDSMAIGWLGIVLAYVSPVLLGGRGASPRPLFLYLTGLNAVVLGISVVRRWTAFRTAAFLATAALYLLWHAGKYNETHLAAVLTFAGVNSAIFLGVLALYPLLRGERTHDADLALAALNPLLTGTLFFTVLRPRHDDWLGGAALLFAAVYWLLSRAIRARRGEEDYLEQLFFATALVFALLAVPLQLKGRAMTAGWAMAGAALSVTGYRTSSLRTRYWGVLGLALAVARLVMVDAWIPTAAGGGPLQARPFSFAVVILSLGTLAAVMADERKRGWEAAGRVLVALVLLMAALMDWWLALDMPSTLIPVGWSGVAAILFAFGWQLRSSGVRAVGMLASLPPLLLCLAEPAAAAALADYRPLPGWGAALALFLGAAAAYQATAPERIPERALSPAFAAAAVALLLLRAARDLPDPWIPVAWAGVSALALGAGMLTRSAGHRAVGAAAAAATLVWLFQRQAAGASWSAADAAGFAACLAALAGAAALYRSLPEESGEWPVAVAAVGGALAVALLWAHAQAPPIWITAAWAAVAAAAFAASRGPRDLPYRIAALAAGGVTLYRLFALMLAALPAEGPWWSRVPAFTACLALCAGMAWSYHRGSWATEAERAWMTPAWGIAAAAVAMVWGLVDLPPGWLPLSWFAITGALLGAGAATGQAPLRRSAAVVALLTTLEVLARELSLPPGGAAVLHPRSAACLAAIGAWSACGWAFARSGDSEERAAVPWIALAANAQALGWLSLEALDVGSRIGPATWAREAAQFGLSAVWGLYGAAAIAVGFWRRLAGARIGGMALLGVVVAKVYLFDLRALALGYRVLSFMLLAAVLFGVGYLYQKQSAAAGRQAPQSGEEAKSG